MASVLVLTSLPYVSRAGPSPVMNTYTHRRVGVSPCSWAGSAMSRVGGREEDGSGSATRQLELASSPRPFPAFQPQPSNTSVSSISSLTCQSLDRRPASERPLRCCLRHRLGWRASSAGPTPYVPGSSTPPLFLHVLSCLAKRRTAWTKADMRLPIPFQTTLGTRSCSSRRPMSSVRRGSLSSTQPRAQPSSAFSPPSPLLSSKTASHLRSPLLNSSRILLSPQTRSLSLLGRVKAAVSPSPTAKTSSPEAATSTKTTGSFDERIAAIAAGQGARPEHFDETVNLFGEMMAEEDPAVKLANATKIVDSWERLGGWVSHRPNFLFRLVSVRGAGRRRCSSDVTAMCELEVEAHLPLLSSGPSLRARRTRPRSCYTRTRLSASTSPRFSLSAAISISPRRSESETTSSPLLLSPPTYPPPPRRARPRSPPPLPPPPPPPPRMAQRHSSPERPPLVLLRST